jgi:transposase-like protein
MSEDIIVAMAAPGPKRRARATAEERAEWAKRFAESGLGQREFCRQHGLVLMTLQRWLERVQSDGGALQATPHFTEVKLSACGSGVRWAAELCRASGWTVRLAHDVPSGLVEQLLGLC